MSKFVDIVFDGPPGPTAGRFVEVENESGASISFGEWVERDDGYWVLRIPDTAPALEELTKKYDDLSYANDFCGNTIKSQEQRIEQLEAALHPGKQSCDCCTRHQYEGESFWMIDCQCGNRDDMGQAQAWCSMANSYEGATGKSVSAGGSAPPAQWTKEPPTEPGTYWLRVLVPVDEHGNGNLVTTDAIGDSIAVEDVDYGEWWPIPQTDGDHGND